MIIDMPGTTRKQPQEKVGESSDIGNDTRKAHGKRMKLKVRSGATTIRSSLSKRKAIRHLTEGKGNGSSRRNLIKKVILHKSNSKKNSFLGCKMGKLQTTTSKDSGKREDQDLGSYKLKKKKKRKRRKENTEVDEASRLQRRTKYLLIKMKMEQNLIDAYSAEGWKGQSREKIRPERELQRAKKQILKCKLGIRDVIRQLDLLSSVGHIDDSAIAPDGSVHHEHIICAKCKLREAFPDNDIILCDGTCNCAFHQKCLDPPLLTENIPPGDEGWFCNFCKSKMEILEATNAHLGTHFAVDSHWKDIFKEEASLPEGGDPLLCTDHEWPSDDSEDDDYDPGKFENSQSSSSARSHSEASDAASSYSSLGSLEEELFYLIGGSEKRSKDFQDDLTELIVGIDNDEATDCEVLSGPRQRTAVDYIKLNHELFGKSAPTNEQNSEDEDWGPTKRRRRGKESDAASTLMTLCESEKTCPEDRTKELEMKPSNGKPKRPIFRIPEEAVEKLRLAFAENELPSRAVREGLSKQLGIESEKVNKWFKNARYLALKARKIKGEKPFGDFDPKMSEKCMSKSGNDRPAAQQASNKPNQKSPCRGKMNRFLNRHLKRKNPKKTPRYSPKHERVVEFGDDVSLKLLKEKAKKEKKLHLKHRGGVTEAEAEMKRLCEIKDRVEKLQLILLGLPSGGSRKADLSTLNESSVIYVPVAEVREKR